MLKNKKSLKSFALLLFFLNTSPHIGETGYKQLYIEVAANISSYTADPLENGGYQEGITSSGVIATAHKTLAMDGISANTLVDISGEDEEWIVEDCFGGDYHKTEPLTRIDRFVATKDEAYDYGRQYKTVRIYTGLYEEMKNNNVQAQ